MAAVLGRERELDAIRQFVGRVPLGSGVLVIEGEPGIGKTTLLREAISEATALGYRVLLASASQAEAEMPFAALGDLLRSVSDELWSAIAGPAANALRTALLLDEPGPDPSTLRAVGLGALLAIQQVARTSALLIVIDDVHWCDRASLSVLQFAARRLADEPAGLVMSVRTLETDPGELAASFGHRDYASVLTVGPISVEALDHLLRARLAAAFSRTSLVQLHAVSAGNPFFALEIGRYLLRERIQPVPGHPLPLPANLRQLVERRIRDLPEATRRLLVLMSALAQPELGVLSRAIGGEAELRAAFEPAVDAGLIECRDGALAFEHPLISSVVYGSATTAARREVHRVLGHAVADEDERIHHLSLAASQPDAALAKLLDNAARRADARGAPHAAAQMMERAVRLTPGQDASEANRRVLREAQYCLRAGDTDRARSLLTRAVEATPDGTGRAQALHLLGRALAFAASMEDAERILLQALTEGSDDLGLRAGVLRDLVVTMLQNGRPGAASTHADELVRTAEETHDEYFVASALAHKASIDFFVGAGVSDDTLERVGSLVAAAERRGTPDDAGILHPLFMCGTLLKWSDSFDQARRLMQRVLRERSERHDEGAVAPILFQLGELECWAGNLAVAGEYGTRCADATRMSAQHARRHLALALQATVELRGGRLVDAEAHAQSALQSSDASGDTQFSIRALALIAEIHLMNGRLAAARKSFEDIHLLFDGGGYGEPGLFRFHGNEIEVFISLGDLVAAEKAVSWLEERARSLQRPWTQVNAARCRGILLTATGELESSLDAFARALALDQSMPDPVERARTHIAFGIALRRAKRKAAAMNSFATALSILERIGAVTWAQHVRGEMSRVGSRMSDAQELTPTERKIAKLAASGASNAEIAQQLFLSIKSVEASLTRVYSKLHVRSRAAMAATLTRRSEV